MARIEMDTEEKHRRITGCIDAIEYLLSSMERDAAIPAATLHPLMALIGEETHRLLDPMVTQVGLFGGAND